MQKIYVFLVFVLSMLARPSLSQTNDSTKNIFHLKGAVTITNKGISLIPTFTLGKPAVIFDLSMGKKKLFFEPQFRTSLSGKPWSFLFWWRYKLVTTNKISFSIGAHPALNFKTETYTVNGVTKTGLIARRYFAVELAPNYFLSKDVSVGVYYLFGSGLDQGTVHRGHFLTLNSNMSNIKLGNRFFARINPQLYYLRQDGKDGFYFTSLLRLSKKNFPLSLESIMNKDIHTTIASGSGFVWNISLLYAFAKKYVPHK